MSLLAFDACVNFRLLSPSTGFFLFFVAQKGVRISGIVSPVVNNLLLTLPSFYFLFLSLFSFTLHPSPITHPSHRSEMISNREEIEVESKHGESP